MAQGRGRILQPSKAFPMSGNCLLDVLSEVIPQMPAVGDLICLWCAGGGAVGIRAGTIAADDLTARMLTQPCGEGGGLPVGQHKPEPWWMAFRSAVLPHPGLRAYDGRFAVDLAVPDSWRSVTIANVAKPLLDGLISALHTHNVTNRDALLPRLGVLGEPNRVWSMICDPAINLLGSRTLLRPHGIGVAWNPADERCHAFRVHGPRVRRPSRPRSGVSRPDRAASTAVRESPSTATPPTSSPPSSPALPADKVDHADSGQSKGPASDGSLDRCRASRPM
jgi:hypothetical protein